MAVNGILLGTDTNSNKYLPLTGGKITGSLTIEGQEDTIQYATGAIKTKIGAQIMDVNKASGSQVGLAPSGIITFNVSDGSHLENNFIIGPKGLMTNKDIEVTRDEQLTHKFYVDNAVSSVKPKVHKITLTAANWADNQQTVTLTGVLADEDSQFILPTPAAASRTMYNDCDIQCITQAADSLTFSCAEVPTDVLSVYILLMDVTLS